MPAHPVGMDLLCALSTLQGDGKEIPVDPLGAQLVRSKVEEVAPSVLPLGEWNGDSRTALALS